MEYYKLQDDLYNPPDRWFLGSVNFENEWEFWKYISAGKVDIPDKQLEITVKKEGIPLDFTLADFGVLIINENVAELINTSDVQLIPIKLKGYKGGKKYYLMVIINEFDCVDENKSVFQKWEKDNTIRPDKVGQYKSIYKLIIKPESVKGCSIFRIKKYDVVVAISEDLKTKFEDHNITGVKYKKIT